VKVDLHVHSKHSRRPSEWILQKLGCAESYTEPLKIYETARLRGMDLVTISDHNCIDGALEIAHLPGTFVSEEVTTYFPEDRCKLHVLVWGLSEAQHREIQALRENLYDLVAYLKSKGLAHGLAHPLFSMDDKLTPDHFERLLLLFRNFELNGSRDDFQNGVLRHIVTGLSPEDVDYLSDRHDMPPAMPLPWVKGLFAGSDDHSGLNIARSHTAADGPTDPRHFLDAVAHGKGAPCGRPATPRTMAYNLYSIAYQFYSHKLDLGRFVGRDLVLRFVDRALTLEDNEVRGMRARLRGLVSHLRAASVRRSTPRTLDGLLQKEALSIVRGDERLLANFTACRHAPWDTENDWFDFVDQAAQRILRHFADRVLDGFSGANLLDVFHALGSAGASYMLLAPYYVAYALFTKDRAFCRTVRDRFAERGGQTAPRRAMRIALFADSFFADQDPIAGLRSQIAVLAGEGREVTVLTCGPEQHAAGEGAVSFAPVGDYALPDCPGLVLHYPPLLKIADHCYNQGFTHVLAASPGPMGLAALAVSRMLGLPLHGIFREALPQTVDRLTGDPGMAEAVWRYLVWLHNQMDAVSVPSRDLAEELAERGVNPDKIRLCPRDVDLVRFTPAKRNGFYAERLGLPKDELRLLYVGRLTREKGLPLLAEAYSLVADLRPDVRLVVVGEGPYGAEMRRMLAGRRATFAGYLSGEDLADAYAAADLFVYPASGRRVGAAVLEAQASGLAVVACAGVLPENMVRPGVTGELVGNSPKDLARAILDLAADRPRLTAMGEAARRHMERRTAGDDLLRLFEESGEPSRAEAV
jgi:glycosyltransferase involved in cell wall biosynthesis